MKYITSNGFSLIEILIASALAGIVGTLLISILVQNQGLFLQQDAKVSQGIGLNNAVATVNESIKMSAGVVLSNPIGSPQYTTDTDTLVLSLSSIDSNGNIIDDTFDYLIIYLDGPGNSVLKKKVIVSPTSARNGEEKVLVNQISQLTFSYLDQNGSPISPISSSKINFVINLAQKAGYKNEQSSASGEINLRNN